MRILLSLFTAFALMAQATGQSTWFVDPAGSNGNTGTSAGDAFATINHANAVASTGDVIRLAAATFGDEQGTIILGDKSLTIVGAGSDATTVQAHSTLTTNINTGFAGTPIATQQRPVILIEGTGRVDFRGICIDGNFAVPANGRLVGLYYRNGADGLVEQCVIKNCRANPLDGGQGSACVIVRGDALGNSCDITLRDCLISEFGKSGVVAFFNTTLEVEECRVVGAGPVGLGSPAQNGIQVSYNASGLIRNSTITNLWYTPSSFAATGILCYDAASVVRIDDNGVGNCEVGIRVEEVSLMSAQVLVRRNRVHCANTAIALAGLTFAIVEDNQFHGNDSTVPSVAFDDNTHQWQRNSYSSYNGIGAHAIGGGGGSVDNTPRNTVDMVGGTAATTPLTGGHSPVDIVVANFDNAFGDDFATIEQNAGLSISVGLNTGGAFNVINLPFAGATAAPIGIVTGEFDGAPGIDIAVATGNNSPATNQNRVYVFSNDGSGAFVLHSSTPIVGFTNTTDIATADVNGDLTNDIVVTNQGSGAGGSAQLLLNNGSGSFVASILPGTFTKSVRAATMANIDAGATCDVALIEGDAASGQLHLLAGNGAGLFVPFGSSPVAIGVDPTDIVNNDLEGDGDNDLLISFGAFTDGAVDTFNNDGTGAFSSIRCLVDGSATRLATGNLDSDSDPDSVFGDVAVVNFNGGSITVLGTYVDGAGYGAGGIAATGVTASAAAFGDFDGNEAPDLFYSDAVAGTVVVLPGKTQARTDWYGFGCAGTKARIPYLRTTGAPGPTQPNLSLGIEVTNAAPFSLGVIVVTLSPAGVLAPCFPQIDLGSVVSSYTVVSNAAGEGGFGLPLPALPNGSGLEIYFQAGILDINAPSLFGLPLALSKGLKLRVGD
jgi:hypothetical protein